MKKQIIFCGLIPRLFSNCIDFFILSFILPFTTFIAPFVYRYAFRDYLEANPEHTIPNFSNPFLSNNAYMYEFLEYVINSNKLVLYFGCVFIMGIINFLVAGVFFIGFWKYKAATPGKLIMGMRIVDADTLGKPSMSQLIKRYFGYITALFGMWSISFTHQRQAIHDKIAGTVVIKV